MLIGQYESKIGEKHQAGLPKKIRDILGEKLIITKGFENCLLIVSEDNWKILLEGTEGKPFTNKSTRELQRFLLGNASYIELDQKGRFVIPEYLRAFAHIDSEVIFLGIQRFVELWDKKSWEEHQQELAKNIESIADKLNEQE
ncbi:MAG TPA: division/cell wall cluster transcriptional repressor MraZ [Candidatus Sulfotelmatobacter sp.]|jgi:MraZ protein|nr:division/cell wall cluster transcriptional repressor MraZ [Candidatus Sulfotelmatobacter sp.]